MDAPKLSDEHIDPLARAAHNAHYPDSGLAVDQPPGTTFLNDARSFIAMWNAAIDKLEEIRHKISGRPQAAAGAQDPISIQE